MQNENILGKNEEYQVRFLPDLFSFVNVLAMLKKKKNDFIRNPNGEVNCDSYMKLLGDCTQTVGKVQNGIIKNSHYYLQLHIGTSVPTSHS
jgi:hypothetical protein